LRKTYGHKKKENLNDYVVKLLFGIKTVPNGL